MAPRRLVKSLNSAIDGFIEALKTERNMRVHFLMAIFALMLGIHLNLSKTELLLLVGAISLVLIVEMINTAVEFTLDLVEASYHPLVKKIKDITAGAVFLAALNSIIIGYAIFAQRFEIYIKKGAEAIVRSPWHITFMALLVLLFFVVFIKVAFQRGTPFRGGMPSGHAAFAFSLWTVAAFFTQNPLVIVITFVLAFTVARHRIKDNVHTIFEVIAGAGLGILVTLTMLKLLI